jgi:hypothetical protein
MVDGGLSFYMSCIGSCGTIRNAIHNFMFVDVGVLIAEQILGGGCGKGFYVCRVDVECFRCLLWSH